MVQKGGCYASGRNAGDIIVEIRSASDSYWNIYCGIKIIWVYCVNETWYVSTWITLQYVNGNPPLKSFLFSL